MEDKINYVIELLEMVRDEPEANSLHDRIASVEKRYRLAHQASEILILDVIGDIRGEQDTYRRLRDFQQVRLEQDEWG